MSQWETRLQALHLTLPELPEKKGNYLLYRRAGDLIFVSGQSAFLGDQALYPGRVGAEVTREQGREAAFETGRLILSILQEASGDLDRVEILKVTGYVASAPDFYDQSWVLNGLSDLFIHVLGERGKHARAAIATNHLALDCCVEVETIARVIPPSEQ